ncbi:MAG: hypothetical protein J6W43_01885 [Prevotella sp.]|nr:hypothetical protein [Prevotella sp.]
MKKYLMTGIAALALCAGFTSCSHDLESLSEDEINELQAKKIVDNYNKAFKAYIGGEVAPNQTWGFGVVDTRTRTENANANEWADPDKEYGGLLVPPAITPTQAAVVKAYFQNVPNLGYKDPQWSNYFIQQVYKGNPETAGANSPEKYLAADGENYILASDHMDHLLAIDPDRNLVDHINNFNHGDCSPNGDVLDNGQHVGGTHHTDKIMYMMNSTTKSFAYHNSDGSLYHTEYTGLVGWETIHNWALTNYTGYDGCLNDTWNRSYMGFDFEQIVGDDVYAKNVDWNRYTAPENQVEGVEYINNFPVTGYKFYTFEGNNYNYLITNRNQYAADKNETSFIGKYNNKVSTPGIADFDNVPNNDVIRELLGKGYLPVDGTADKTWVKVGGTADGYFSDWIVTLTEAKTNNTPTPTTWSIRVMAEDLSATEASDFDFNDVVFDVTYTEGQSTATITLRAAGGTLPLKIGSTNGNGGFEVHEAFGNYPTTTMINTNWTGSNGANDVTASPQTISFSATDEASFLAAVNAIRIEVRKTLPNGQYQWFLITAEQGEPAGKFAVPTTVNWCSERSSIKGEYPLFVTWATSDDAWDFIWW